MVIWTSFSCCTEKGEAEFTLLRSFSDSSSERREADVEKQSPLEVPFSILGGDAKRFSSLEGDGLETMSGCGTLGSSWGRKGFVCWSSFLQCVAGGLLLEE